LIEENIRALRTVLCSTSIGISLSKDPCSLTLLGGNHMAKGKISLNLKMTKPLYVVAIGSPYCGGTTLVGPFQEYTKALEWAKEYEYRVGEEVELVQIRRTEEIEGELDEG
jgi:hypothetical protein